MVRTELAVPLSYGEARYFRFDLRDAGARLRFLTVATAAGTDGADASTTRSALLVSRGRCPSVDAYDVGSWAEDATAAQASLANVVRSVQSAAEDGTTLAAFAHGGVQPLTVPYDVATEGTYYLALVGISPDPVELQLFGAVQCELGPRGGCAHSAALLACVAPRQFAADFASSPIGWPALAVPRLRAHVPLLAMPTHAPARRCARSVTLAGYETTTFTNSCTPCPVGYFRNDPESVRCELCAQGSFAAREGTSNCTVCAPGTFLPPAEEGDPPALECLLCPPGTAQPASAQTSCVQCVDGTYNPDSGMAGCFDCPNNTRSFVGATRPEDCTCKATFYSPTSRTGADCLECPVGSTCEGGRIGPYSQAGYWQLANARYQRVYPSCALSAACLAGNTCAEGYTGMLCARCDAGFYRRSSLCYACPAVFGESLSAEGKGRLVLFLTAVGFVAIALILFLLSGPEQLERTTSFFITFNFLQLVNYFPLFRLGWPQFALDLFASLAIFNLNVELLSFECYFQSIGFVQKLLISFALPFFMFAVLGVLLVVFSAADLVRLLVARFECLGTEEKTVATATSASRLGGGWPQPEQPHAARGIGELCGSLLQHRLNRFISAQLMFVNLCYVYLAYNVGTALQCREVTASRGLEPALSVLEHYPEVECGSEDYQRIAWLGVAGLALYVVGFPLSMFIVISRGRQAGAFENPTFIHRFGFFYLRFDDDYWFWEFALMLRKLVVVYGAMFLNECAPAGAVFAA